MTGCCVLPDCILSFFSIHSFSSIFERNFVLNVNFEPYEKSVSWRGRICIRTQWCESSGVSSWTRVISALIGPGTYRSIVVTQFQLCRIYRNFLFIVLHCTRIVRKKKKKERKTSFRFIPFLEDWTGRTFIGVDHVYTDMLTWLASSTLTFCAK